MTMRLLFAGLLSFAAAAMSLNTPARAQGSATTARGQSGTNWSLHNFDIHNSRYAPVDEINASNVGRLQMKWSFDVPGSENVAQVTPLVVDSGDFYAIDARSGKQLFKHTVKRGIRASPVTYQVNFTNHES